MSENLVEAQIAKWMQARGFRRQRNHIGVFKPAHGGAPITIGKKGWPDFTYFRTVSPGLVQVAHVEVKSPGKKPRQEQAEAIASLNHIGEPAWYADSIEMHEANYSAYFTD